MDVQVLHSSNVGSFSQSGPPAPPFFHPRVQALPTQTAALAPARRTRIPSC